MIQLHRLEGFYWVAKTGGYASAARAFPYPITQPAVHQQVKKLETELGVTLFERVAKDKIQPTPAGERMFQFCAPFFEQLPGVLRSLDEGAYGGRLRIHAAPLFLRELLPPWLHRLRQAKPDLQVDLHELVQPDLQLLRGGEADLIVDHMPVVPDDVGTLQVGTSHAFVVFPSNHPLAKRKAAPLSELADDPFISYTPDTLPHSLQMKALAEHAVEPQHVLSAGSAETILGFVEAGLGWSLVPSMSGDGPAPLASSGGTGLVARPLLKPKVEFAVHAAWRLDTPDNPLLDAALETAPRA